MRTHGTYSCYCGGCRCADCKAASATYARARYKPVDGPHRSRIGFAQVFFAEHVNDQTDECIVWPFNKNNHGYGMLQWKGRRTTAHALACELRHGPRPEGMEVNHTCDTRACFNGAHLKWGTHRENINARNKARGWKTMYAGAAFAATVLLGGVGTAAAHTPSVVATCSGLQINLTQYEAGNGSNNLVTIGIDNQPPGGVFFGSSYTHTFSWSQTANHSYSVQIDANRQSGNATQYDKVFTGSSTACQVAPTTTTTPPTTSTAVTTTTQPVVTTTVVEPTTTVVAVDLPPVPCAYDIALPADSPLCLQVVAVADPIPTVPVELGIASRILPATGRSNDIAFAAGLALLAGFSALVIARRRAT